VIETLLDQGYLGDERFAARFTEDRRKLDGWGSERIEERLIELGIDRELAAEAVAQPAGNELEAAIVVLAHRFPQPPQDVRDRNRALGVLVRRGYELELAHDALREHQRRAA
jgi:regulatory protein